MASDQEHGVVVVSKREVCVGAYGNCFVTIGITLGGFSCIAHIDQSSFSPHIKIKDQKMQLNRIADLLVDCINRGADSLEKEEGKK